MVDILEKIIYKVKGIMYCIYTYICKYVYISGQIIATSHDLTPKGSLVTGIPLFQGNPGW